jgi:hypothetical protein
MNEGPVRILRGSKGTERWLLTTAIGGDYFDRWSATVREFWEDYASRHQLGIAVVVGDLFVSGEPELNGSWQKMLAPRALRDLLGHDVRCALIDTDLLMAGNARCVFDAVPRGHIGVVSQERALPFPVERLRRRIALLRRTFVDPEFPLTSILNAEPRQLFEWSGLPPFDDYFCAGMFVVDTCAHADVLAGWYRDAPKDDRYEQVGSWEEVWLNFCVQSRDDVAWLDYSWHALWIYEVAALYPFLYADACPSEVVQWCLASSLLRNDFVHLAGRWESGLLRGNRPALPSVADLQAFARTLGAHEETVSEAVMRGRLAPPSV